MHDLRLYIPDTPPTPPKAPVVPHIIEASHSTSPVNVRFDPYPGTFWHQALLWQREPQTCVHTAVYLEECDSFLDRIERCLSTLQERECFLARSALYDTTIQ